MNKIHVITTIDDKKFPYGSRTVGFYFDLEIAIDEVENNSCDIHENSFKYCVIESITQGLYIYDIKGIWFEWKEESYIQIKKPEKFKGVGYGIG